MVINKLGTIRGSLQRVAKLELDDKKSDEIINKASNDVELFQTS